MRTVRHNFIQKSAYVVCAHGDGSRVSYRCCIFRVRHLFTGLLQYGSVPRLTKIYQSFSTVAILQNRNIEGISIIFIQYFSRNTNCIIEALQESHNFAIMFFNIWHVFRFFCPRVFVHKANSACTGSNKNLIFAFCSDLSGELPIFTT